jgi:hypothetical protein
MIQSIIQIGEPVAHRGIVIAPLFPRRDPVARYVTLDEALAGGLRVREVDESGAVPELVVENPLDARVLLYDGEELVGAKQNRILNVSVLVEAKTTVTIPVSCVEEGRWSRESRFFRAGGHVSHAELRRRKAEAQAAQPLARGISQSEVWDALHEKAMDLSVSSPTGASSDLYRARGNDLRSLEDAFPAQPGQCGAVFGFGVDLCLDLVSRPDAFAHLWPKLRSGYLLDALERLDAKPAPTKDLVAFVRVVDGSLPEDLRARAEVLLVEGNLDRAEAICDEVGESADDLRVMIALKRGDTAEALRLAKEIDRAS